MKFTLLRKELLSPYMERWYFQLAPAYFTAFGFFIESLEGIGLHHSVPSAQDIMQVDVAIGFSTDLEYLLSILADQE